MMRLATLIHLSLNIIFWMHSIGIAHGNTLWPPWITLSGCFNYSSNNATSNIPNNEPTKCFETCQGDQSIGLKNMLCICNPLYKSSDIHLNRRCNVSCPGKVEVYCGSESAGTELMSVYTRDTPLINGINGSSIYGYGYVVISGGNPIVHSSDNNTSLQYGYLCYDDFVSLRASPCIFEKSTVSTWADAINGCNGRGARLITALDVLKCPKGSAYDGTYWIGNYREKPDYTTSTAITSIAASTATTASRLSTSLKPTPSFKTTTDSRSNHNLNTPVIEQSTKASSSDGIDVVAVAASVAVIVVVIFVVLTSILICKKRKLLCFKISHKSDVAPEIPEVFSSKIPVSVPPGSTRDPFQIPYQNGRPITARVRAIESGQIDQTVFNSNIFSSGMSDNTQSDIKGGEKRKDKKEKKTVEKDMHSAIEDKEYAKIETNSKTNIESLERLTNDNLSDVNGRTGHPNGEDKDNTRKKKKKKRKRTREDTYTDENVNKASTEPGSELVSGHHSKHTITSASQDRVQITEKQPDQPNKNVSDARKDKMEQDEMLSEAKIETLSKKYDELVFAPPETLAIENQTDLNIERLGRKHKKKRRKENGNVNEDGVEEDEHYLNEVYKELNDGNIDTKKDKKKKRKKSRERSKEKKVLKGYDELVDAPAANLVLEERTDLQNEGSNKKHKKRKKKKDKKRGDENVGEQTGLDLEIDEND